MATVAAVSTQRSFARRGRWRRRRPAPAARAPADCGGASALPPLSELLWSVRGASPPLTGDAELAGAFDGLRLDEVLRLREGLPRLAAALDDGEEEMRVCYLGGSVTEQKAGYRPLVTAWLRAAAAGSCRVEEVPAFCGNCGSKVLAFMVADWVVSRRPQLVFIELAINDGDTLLETGDADGIGSAFEGIVRHVRDALPRSEICLLYMYVRDDLPLHLRTGSKAWADNTDAAAAATYTAAIPRLHDGVADRYGLPSIRLAPLMARLPPHLRQRAFRDDCHFLPPGAALAAAAISASLQATRAAAAAAAAAGRAAATGRAVPLPPPLHARPWGRGRAEEVQPDQLSFFYAKEPPRSAAEADALRQRLVQRHTQLDMNPLANGEQRPWWLLYAGETATLRFSGTRLAFLTMIGPDAGVVSCEVDGGRWRCRRQLAPSPVGLRRVSSPPLAASRQLLDRWSYFWRLAVVLLVEEMPPGEHTAVLRLEPEVPDPSVLRRPPSGPHWEAFRREGKAHKLWLMHWLVEESSELERAVVRGRAGGGAGSAARRLGGAGMAAGGRRADV